MKGNHTKTMKSFKENPKNLLENFAERLPQKLVTQ